ncbi:DUF461 domain-containing protein [Streptomyces telluris]|uniref:DUF461 domain-containing protein n=1 Tax=Streptomyces telluris TaxID=2720021 RepID=A0A9X2RL11_9ACTN|nr:DUF461 domain-containing protein [Streptomyces telluris]MCQ8769079.1 DUF461 domain-containing protein [Streptomyces telluris]NJP80783.1 DUF461 domain-containing protein [Streptomyces telluris]
MSSSLRRGALAATALVLSIASLTACAAGNSAQTLEVKPDNAATSVGDIKLQNLNVITQPDLNAKGPAVITGQVFNNGRKDQTLRTITLAGKNGAKAKLSPAKGSGDVVVPAGGSVLLGGKGNASAVLPEGREALKDGEQQELAFDFSETGEVRIGAFVVPATSYFKDWGPSEAAPTPAAKPGGTKPSGQPGGQPSGQPGEPSTAPSGAASGAPAGAAGKPSPATGQASQGAQQPAGR